MADLIPGVDDALRPGAEVTNPRGCYIPLTDAERETDESLPGTTPALEPATEPNHPMTAAQAEPFIEKIIA